MLEAARAVLRSPYWHAASGPGSFVEDVRAEAGRRRATLGLGLHHASPIIIWRCAQQVVSFADAV
jgi:hypothetical protein